MQMIYMLKGKLRTAFVEEAGGTRGAVVNDVSEGDSTFFPKGLVHYQQNLECDEASYVAAVNSEDPGVVFIVPTFFSLPDGAVEVCMSHCRTQPMQRPSRRGYVLGCFMVNDMVVADGR